MTDFKGIRGWKVQTLSTDPSAGGIASATWSSGGTANQARAYVGSAGRTQNDGLVFGGQNPPSRYTNTESYDGSTWTEVNDLNTSRSQGNYGTSGTSTSALATAGQPSPSDVVESWDGTNWTEVAENNTARYASSNAVLSNTSGLIFGGEIPGSGYQAITEEWNGSAWTEVADLNTAGGTGAGVGITTAALLVGRQGPPNNAITNVEEWNGSAWTETTDFNTARRNMGQAGLYTAALVFGGAPPTPVKANTEDWNGTAWTERADLSSGVAGNGGNGTRTSAVSSFGITPTYTAASEEFSESTAPRINLGQVYFNSTANAFKVTEQSVPSTSWSSGTSLNSTRAFNNAAGSIPSAITFGGSPAPTQAYAEQWNGSAWTEVADLNEGRVGGAGGGASGTDAIMAGGYELPNVSNSLNTEIWDGSTWTEVNNLNAQKYTAGSAIPISTSGIAFGGNPAVATAEVWDGTNWTEVGDLNSARQYLGGFGSATSAIAGNGIEPGASPPIFLQNKVEQWDGSSWTEVSEFNTARAETLQGQGSSNTAGIIAGGSTTGSNQLANTEIWDGSSWTELNDLATARRMGGQIGSTTNGMYVGGNSGPGSSTTVEEWNTPLSNATITVS